MRILSTELSGLKLVELERMVDERGYFARTFCSEEFVAHGLETNFVQESVAFNGSAGTVRGMHYQRSPGDEIKLIRCTRGAVHDIVVDIRVQSPTYLRSFSMRLDAEGGTALYVPKGFAHGYQSIEDNTEMLYAISSPHRPELATGLRWDDPALGIAWPLAVAGISARDQGWPLLGEEDCELQLSERRPR